LQLDEKCRDFIRWRKLKEMTDYQINQKYPKVDWESRTPDDIVFRCVCRLKGLVEDQVKKLVDEQV